MPKVTIDSLYNLDGEYPLDLTFTHRDFRDIKKIAGVRANEVMDALNAGDMDIIVALAAIALRRSGKTFDVEQLWDAEAGHITLDLTDEEAEANADASPPPIKTDDEPLAQNGSSAPSGTPTSEPTELSLVSESPSPSGTPVQASSALGPGT
jgi:hypothetical protein